jgi:hypothetical protein
VKPHREDIFKQKVREVVEDNNCYWIGGGDYCDFINKSDPRFSASILADWFTVPQIDFISEAQVNHFCEIIKPIAHKCLGLLCGNHETAIQRHYEHSVFHEIVGYIKRHGKFRDEDKLALGYDGWIELKFRRSLTAGTKRVIINCHHGFAGGRLAGAKALAMQRWLWQKDCDIALMGHSHDTLIQSVQVEGLDRNSKFITKKRRGAYCGTFLDTTMPGIDTYSSVRGYPPMPVGGVEIVLRPTASNEFERIKLSDW